MSQRSDGIAEDSDSRKVLCKNKKSYLIRESLITQHCLHPATEQTRNGTKYTLHCICQLL